MHLRARRDRSVGGNLLADRAFSCACGSSSVATLLGEADQAQSAIARALELDETEPNLERADFADSYTNPDAAEMLLNALRGYREATAPLLYAIQGCLVAGEAWPV